MNIRQLITALSCLTCSACGSSVVESIRARGEIGTVPVRMMERRAPPLERCVQDGKLWFKGVVAQVILPVYDLKAFHFTQPRVQIRFVYESPSKRRGREARLTTSDARRPLTIGPIVGRFVISHPNDAALEKMNALTEHMGKISWRAQGGVWMSNTTSLIIGMQGVGMYPAELPSETNARILLGEHGGPDGFFESELLVAEHGHRTMSDDEFGPREMFFAPWIPEFEGTIEFRPRWIGLMVEGTLLGCVPVT